MKRLRIFAFAFLAIIALIAMFGAVSAVPCGSVPQTIISLYSDMNSHAATAYSSQYSVKVRYDTLFGREYTWDDPTGNCEPTACVTGSDGRNNGVVSLYSNINSHVSTYGTAGYNVPICYGDLRCTMRTTACSAGEAEVARLSGIAGLPVINAHISTNQLSSYVNRICCSSSTPPVTQTPETVSEAYWTDQSDNLRSQAKNNEIIKMVAKGNATLVNEYIKIKVFNSQNNQQILSDYVGRAIDDGNGNAIYSETINPISLAFAGLSVGQKIYFVAYYPNSANTIPPGVRSIDLEYIPNGATFNCRPDTAEWQKTGSSVGQTFTELNLLDYPTPSAADNANINIHSNVLNCDGSEQFTINVYENNEITPDNTFIVSAQSSEINNMKTAGEIISSPVSSKINSVYKFKVVYAPNPTPATSGTFVIRDSVSPGQCSRLTESTRCNNAVVSPGPSASPPSVTFNNPTCTITGTDPYNGCEWVAGICKDKVRFLTSTGVEVAKCIFTRDPSKDDTSCGSDGKKTIYVGGDLVASAPGCTGTCDPCANGYCEVPCGRAVATLPFFTALNLIIAVIVIAIIYTIIKSKKLMKRKR